MTDLAPIGGDISPNSLSAMKKADPLRHVSQQFEAVLLSQMLSLSGDFGNQGITDSFATSMWQTMLNDAFGEVIANAGGLGVADIIYRQLQQKNQP